MQSSTICNRVSLAPGCIVDGLVTFAFAFSHIYCCHFTFAEHVFACGCVGWGMGSSTGAGKAAGGCQMRFVAAIVNMARNEERRQGIFAFFGSVSATWLGNGPEGKFGKTGEGG